MIRKSQIQHCEETVTTAGSPDRSVDRVVCQCLNVTECDIRNAAVDGCVQSVRDVTQDTCAGGGCTSCHREIRKILLDCGIEEKRPVRSKDAALELLAILTETS